MDRVWKYIVAVTFLIFAFEMKGMIPYVEAESVSLCISEVMVKNHATVLNTESKITDWIEIENLSDDAISLEGWAISDGKNKCFFPAYELKGHSFFTIQSENSSESMLSFGLSEDKQLFLLDPNGIEMSTVKDLHSESDYSIARLPDGSYRTTPWPTPGYENTKDGYVMYCDSLLQPDLGLVINEACNANTTFQPFYGSGTCDWIELKNISEHEINLSSYFLSDKYKDKQKWRLPARILEPGEILMIFCSDEMNNGNVFAPFSLSVPSEGIWLTREDGIIADMVFLHDVPVDGSCGRIDGRGGFFYFESGTPGKDNVGGYRFVVSQPEPSVCPMSYDVVDTMTVELSCEEGAEIYYTTDCSIPKVGKAQRYTEPITLDRTTIIRTIAVKENACTSQGKTLSYIINGGHSVPVLSLVVDNFPAFQGMYYNQQKNYEIRGTLSLFEDGEEIFNNACGVQMKGWTSLHLPKKSLGVYFRGKYGDGEVKQDLFSNGVADYSSLSIRAGQDYTFTVVRNELFQRLCTECFENVLTQNGKYCALYINGQYWGLYCLKENINEQYFASLKGIDEDTVLTGKGQADYGIGLREAIEFSYQNDMAEKENYEHFCSLFNIDSLIGWIIMEGYSGNSDTVNNIRYFSSPEFDDGRWQLCYYDLDWGFTYFDFAFSNVIGGAGNPGYQMTEMIKALLENEQFRSSLLSRFSALIRTTLSNENVLAEFDEMIALVEEEVIKDRQKWEMSSTGFQHRVDEFRRFIIENDYDNFCITKVCSLLNVTPEEWVQYFKE